MTNVAARSARSQWARRLRRLLEPRFLLGLGAGISLLLLLGSFADWREVLAIAAQLPPALLLVSAAGHLFGAVCRGARWLLMLHGAGVRVAARPALAASFGSDLLGPLPASPFVASYVLHRNGAASATQTIPVVLAGLWAEVVTVIGGTAVVPGAAPAVVRALAAALCLVALVGALLLQLPLVRRRFGGVARAFGPRTLAPAVVLTALPLAVGASVTAAVAASLGYPQLTAPNVWAASGTVMALALASPLPFDLGVVEGGQLLAYGWVGVPAAGALAIALIGRMWSATIGLLIAGAVTWVLREDLG
ncbi:MAG TPA: lysylphosphatidylglycerol synthase domain-containing protein [Chloroflexota bacterium]|nr:lysylphosphatidylglycerol synthase domain-containing protein [Chloroflexota bacterium]